MKAIGVIALILSLVGALNWGLLAVFDLDLVKVVLPAKEEAADEAAEDATPSDLEGMAESATEAGEEAADKAAKSYDMSKLQMIVYIIIGVSPIVFLISLPCCKKKKCSSGSAGGAA